MVARRCDNSLRVLKNISRVRCAQWFIYNRDSPKAPGPARFQLKSVTRCENLRSFPFFPPIFLSRSISRMSMIVRGLT